MAVVVVWVSETLVWSCCWWVGWSDLALADSWDELSKTSVRCCFLCFWPLCFRLLGLLVVDLRVDFGLGGRGGGAGVVGASVFRGEPAERWALRCSRMAMPECHDDSSSESMGLQAELQR